MRALNISELAFAGMLATLVPATATKEQHDAAEVLLKAYVNKCLALDCLSAEYIGLKIRLDDFKSEVGVALARTCRPLEAVRPVVPASGLPVRLVKPEGG